MLVTAPVSLHVGSTAWVVPSVKVAMAAYGDYGPCYIGTAIAYDQGGYETSAGATNVSAAVEPVLLGALTELLQPADK